MAGKVIRLFLPLPPSGNSTPRHRMQKHRAKRAYQRKCWATACVQHKPPRDPPDKVRVSAHCYVHNLRDEDGLHGGLKWLLDALRQKQQGSLGWRQGIADECGFFIDDDPAHLELASVTQEIERKHKGVEVVIEAIEAK